MKLNLNPILKARLKQVALFGSHDENSYQFNFDFTEYLCDKPFDLTDGKPRILLEFLNDKNAEVQIYPLVVDSEKLGVAHFIIPERVLGYAGDVKASLTIDFSNKSYDLGNFSFRMKKSPIDNKMPNYNFMLMSLRKHKIYSKMV
ncbi:BppU family phage baseplate upper protein [Vagococcus sp. CY52-2]|uniref:BppU family phage baseplate upper protein n=1 Tax=Vagococcus sp. CY52-2 TaxID=2925838 RepID=UPI001F568FC2|nr:BppU family phage baseplate upper protein [Vagococcus sp. CY52-2]UNM90547.1 phage baseplate upper protein [Vagococcus sp. CY52-2]